MLLPYGILLICREMAKTKEFVLIYMRPRMCSTEGLGRRDLSPKNDHKGTRRRSHACLVMPLCGETDGTELLVLTCPAATHAQAETTQGPLSQMATCSLQYTSAGPKYIGLPETSEGQRELQQKETYCHVKDNRSTNAQTRKQSREIYILYYYDIYCYVCRKYRRHVILCNYYPCHVIICNYYIMP